MNDQNGRRKYIVATPTQCGKTMQKLPEDLHNKMETSRKLPVPGLWRSLLQTIQEVKNLFWEYLDPLINGTRGERNTWIALHLLFAIGAAGFFAAWRLTP